MRARNAGDVPPRNPIFPAFSGVWRFSYIAAGRVARATDREPFAKPCYSTGSVSFRRFSGTAHYLTNENLEAAVDCALALERPLLVKGEPGTGKTLLAQAIAESLGLDLIHWPVKSTTRAQDGLYVYDTVQRLYDARFGDGDVKDIRRYIKLGPMGKAFAASQRVVILIDEVDKADIEFPNDLLHELDRMRFVIPETGDEVVASQRPVVIITSNNEKELPDAFLRRCVFHFIDFPDPELMKRIVRVHHPKVDDALIDQAVVAFYELRAVPRLRKRPSTSELVDWIAVLMQEGTGKERLVRELPFLGVLLKKEQDVELLRAVKVAGGRR
jgi:MoxR-like ATPase